MLSWEELGGRLRNSCAHFWRTKSYLYKVSGSYFEYFWTNSEHVKPDPSRWPISAFCITSHWSILRMFITIWKWIASLTLLQINWSVHLVLTIELSSPMNSQQPWLPKLSTSIAFWGWLTIYIFLHASIYRDFLKYGQFGNSEILEPVECLGRAILQPAEPKVKSLARSYRKMLFKD